MTSPWRLEGPAARAFSPPRPCQRQVTPHVSADRVYARKPSTPLGAAPGARRARPATCYAHGFARRPPVGVSWLGSGLPALQQLAQQIGRRRRWLGVFVATIIAAARLRCVCNFISSANSRSRLSLDLFMATRLAARARCLWQAMPLYQDHRERHGFSPMIALTRPAAYTRMITSRSSKLSASHSGARCLDRCSRWASSYAARILSRAVAN